ncbi:MAG TPA: nuclear transport factor 2 family protein [Pseudacidobacterium sp.]|nr:nuclear transport factor 2 family protein [Pseudacidobacterium sp.]
MRLFFLKISLFSACLALLFSSTQLRAEGCDIHELANQQHDEATVQRLETAFTNAFLKGDTDFEKCLLLSNYAETSRLGKWRVLSDELEGASRNRGRNLSIPEMPKVDVLMHGDTAIAHGVFTFTGADGKSQSMRFSDVYVWTDDAWHVLFSQQTPVAAN